MRSKRAQIAFLPLFIVATRIAAIPSPCKQLSACECIFTDDSRIDLFPLFANNSNTYLNVSQSNFTIYYHGCVDFKFQLDINNVNDEKCRNAASMCSFNATSRDIFTVAKAIDGKFTAHQSAGVALSYARDNQPEVLVALVCTPEFDDNVLMMQDIAPDGKRVNLNLFTRHACRIPHVAREGLSVGSQLLIVFTAFSFIYLFGGVLFAKYVRGAQGHELLPHVDFWRELPSLVRDGFLFLLSGCNPHLLLSADTYNQI